MRRWQVFGVLEKGRRELSKPRIEGKWDEGLWADMEDGSRVELWRPAPPPPDPTRRADPREAKLHWAGAGLASTYGVC